MFVRRILNEDTGTKLQAHSENIHRMAELLRKCLKEIFSGLELEPKKAFPPIVWCRIAVQFWLRHGGAQVMFMSEMTKWVRAKNKAGSAYVVYRTEGHSKSYRMPLEAFLFGADELPDLSETHWIYKRKESLPSEKIRKRRGAAKSAKDQIGSRLLETVRHAVGELKRDSTISSRFKKGIVRDSDKFRFVGLREELYEALCNECEEIGNKRGSGEVTPRKKYSRNSVIKAISAVAICKRSWGPRAT